MSSALAIVNNNFAIKPSRHWLAVDRERSFLCKPQLATTTKMIVVLVGGGQTNNCKLVIKTESSENKIMVCSLERPAIEKAKPI